MIGVLQDTEQTANQTAVELTNQREQIGRITEDAIEIDTLLTRADRLVKVFSKRMMTDKVRCTAVGGGRWEVGGGKYHTSCLISRVVLHPFLGLVTESYRRHSVRTWSWWH